MFASGRGHTDVHAFSPADARGEWPCGLLDSRDLAACVVEVCGDAPGLDYRFLAVSPGFAEATGLHDAVGRSMRALRPDHEPYWFELYAHVAETGEAASFDHVARAFDRKFHGYAFRVGDPEARQVAIVFEDGSPPRREHLARASLDGADARLERFGATLAHELRGPLAALCNGLHIVKRSAHGQEELRWALAMMERQLGRLSGFIDDLLEVGRLGSSNVRMQRDHVNLHHVLSESIEACAAAIDARRHEVTVDSDDDVLMVRGDLRRLTQVFTNLLSNSVKFTPAGGHIRIRLKKQDGMAVVEVRDDGVGIPAEDLPHVFDYFKQGSRLEENSRGGLGIGLSIVRSVVVLHSGTVTVHSDGVGAGSTFVVQLPLAPVVNLG